MRKVSKTVAVAAGACGVSALTALPAHAGYSYIPSSGSRAGDSYAECANGYGGGATSSKGLWLGQVNDTGVQNAGSGSIALLITWYEDAPPGYGVFFTKDGIFASQQKWLNGGLFAQEPVNWQDHFEPTSGNSLYTWQAWSNTCYSGAGPVK